MKLDCKIEYTNEDIEKNMLPNDHRRSLPVTVTNLSAGGSAGGTLATQPAEHATLKVDVNSLFGMDTGRDGGHTGS